MLKERERQIGGTWVTLHQWLQTWTENGLHVRRERKNPSGLVSAFARWWRGDAHRSSISSSLDLVSKPGGAAGAPRVYHLMTPLKDSARNACRRFVYRSRSVEIVRRKIGGLLIGLCLLTLNESNPFDFLLISFFRDIRNSSWIEKYANRIFLSKIIIKTQVNISYYNIFAIRINLRCFDWIYCPDNLYPLSKRYYR